MKRTVKFLLMLLIIAGTAPMTSCQKDKTGVYTPKKKIQRIYLSSDYLDKTPFQHWEWNDDKLNTITHYSESGYKGANWIEYFTYDGNRIIRVDNYTNSEYITYEYDGNHLKSATVYFRNSIVCTWTASYDGDHINKLTGTIYEPFFKENLHLDPLSHLLPPTVCDNVVKCEQQMAQERHQQETFTLVLLLTWTDDNISNIVFTGEGDYVDFQLQYDDKNCPWYNFMGGLEDYLLNFTTGHTGFTKHNITSMIVTEGDYSDTLRFAYQYDSDKYPILQTMYYVDEPDDKTVLYYEY